MIYLDYAASSPPFPAVIEKMNATAMNTFGNPGALHTAGAAARIILQHSRQQIASALQVRPEEVIFTSGGTESNNLALQTGCCRSGKKHILCCAAEHSSVLEPMRRMTRIGYKVTYLNPDPQGLLSPAAVEEAIRPDTGLLCVQAVNNETGVMQDVDALAAVAHRHNVRFFCDGVQSAGHTSQNLHCADLISLSAHKLGGPRGIGCLVIRQPLFAEPVLLGGGQEFGARSGTENIPAIAGFALAVQLSSAAQVQQEQRLKALQAQFEKELQRIYPSVEIAGKAAPRTAITCCRFPGISAEEMVMRLDLKGICASPGAACAAGKNEASHVLLSMGRSRKEAAEFVRFSPGRNTTEEELQKTISAISDIIMKRGLHHGNP